MTKSATSDIKPIKENSQQWRDEAHSLARSYCPPIYSCRKCTHPVVSGYCCQTCGTGFPDTTVEQDLAWERKYANKHKD